MVVIVAVGHPELKSVGTPFPELTPVNPTQELKEFIMLEHSLLV